MSDEVTDSYYEVTLCSWSYDEFDDTCDHGETTRLVEAASAELAMALAEREERELIASLYSFGGGARVLSANLAPLRTYRVGAKFFSYDDALDSHQGNLTKDIRAYSLKLAQNQLEQELLRYVQDSGELWGGCIFEGASELAAEN